MSMATPTLCFSRVMSWGGSHPAGLPRSMREFKRGKASRARETAFIKKAREERRCGDSGWMFRRWRSADRGVRLISSAKRKWGMVRERVMVLNIWDWIGVMVMRFSI